MNEKLEREIRAFKRAAGVLSSTLIVRGLIIIMILAELLHDSNRVRTYIPEVDLLSGRNLQISSVYSR